MLIDLEVDASFPTLGKSGATDGDVVWLASAEAGLVADNVLGAWSDSYDCSWFDLYLDGEYAPNQQWTIHNVNPGGGAAAFGRR